MKAAICTRYGPPEVLEVREVETPTPQAGEIRIRIHATTVSSGDCRTRAFDVPPEFWIPGRLALGLTRPRRPILGSEFAGEVDAVGEGVTRFQVGDAVFASTGYDMGGNAEYCCMPANGIVATKPANLTFQEAAAVPFGARTALFLLRDQGRIEAGQHILINGASGSVGTYAVQLACHFGAQVTAVCSTRHVEVVRSLGADHVIDYTREDFTQGSETYDLIFDAVGKTTVPRCRPILKPAGTFVSAVMPFSAVKGLWYRLTEGRRVLGGSIPRDPELLLFLRDLCEAGAVRPVIERRYPLDEIVEAHRYVDQGHKQGNVVITVAH